MNTLFQNLCRHVNSYCSVWSWRSKATASILIIGDEILKGTVDLNAPFLIRELNEINVKVCKVAILPDNVPAIAGEVREMASKCTYVFTSGGIGPTHDDVTYEAVARACDDELELNETLFNFLVNYFGPESAKNPAIVKFSNIPKSSIVKFVDLSYENRINKYPIVSLRNIYIFPGVPSLLEKSFNALKYSFVQRQSNFTKEMYIDLDEFTVISVLNEAVKMFEDVYFGSYPTFTDNYYKIKLVMESVSLNKIEEACSFLKSRLPDFSIVTSKGDIVSNAEDVYSLKTFFSPVSESLSIIEQALHGYSLSELCVCFNGGKDCTALLHLIYACVKKHKSKECNKIQYLYIRSGEEFEEVNHFIEATVKLYNLNLTVLEGELKETVSNYLKNNSNIKAMFIGTRKDDPGAYKLKPFSLTDSDWPSVLRILPIINWSYSDVWHFIRTLQLPYCILYDRGYTSLGVKSQTVRNPSLLQHNKGFQFYKPAYKLIDCESERKSRS